MRFLEWLLENPNADLKAENDRLAARLNQMTTAALEYERERDEALARIVELTRGRCTCAGCGREVNNAWRDSDGHWCLTCLAKSRDGARRISEQLRSGYQKLCATNARLREEVEQLKIALRPAQISPEYSCALEAHLDQLRALLRYVFYARLPLGDKVEDHLPEEYREQISRALEGGSGE